MSYTTPYQAAPVATIVAVDCTQGGGVVNQLHKILLCDFLGYK